MWCHWTGIRSCHGTSTWVTLMKVMRTKGTPDYDRMFGPKPLMDTIRLACQGFFHPGQNHSIDERMVETKAQHSMKKFIQSKPTKWGHRLFVLADSSDGYTASHSLPVMFPDKTIIQQLWLSSVCRQLLHFWRPPPPKKQWARTSADLLPIWNEQDGLVRTCALQADQGGQSVHSLEMSGLWCCPLSHSWQELLWEMASVMP